MKAELHRTNLVSPFNFDITRVDCNFPPESSVSPILISFHSIYRTIRFQKQLVSSSMFNFHHDVYRLTITHCCVMCGNRERYSKREESLYPLWDPKLDWSGYCSTSSRQGKIPTSTAAFINPAWSCCLLSRLSWQTLFSVQMLPNILCTLLTFPNVLQKGVT